MSRTDGRRRTSRQRAGRMAALTLLLGPPLLGTLLLSGCNDGPKQPKPLAQRAQSVTARPSQQASAKGRAPNTRAAATAPAKPRNFCQGQSERETPGDITLGRAVEGATSLPPLRYGGDRWLWLNLWAAWCQPCKKEMPLLLRWRDELRAAGVKLDLVFVSIDDDEREMTRFMKTQPAAGVRATYWLEEGEARESWFASIGYDDIPQLPIHLLVAPSGKLACVVEGAVEKRDYPQVLAYLK